MGGSERPIGIFDSGVGGLTVVSEVIKQLPNENLLYFGDTARVPYGSKSKETIIKYTKQIMNFMLAKNVKAVIIACNTISSNCYEEISEEYKIPIIEVVRPGVKMIIDGKFDNIGIIGTRRTINSCAYEKMIHKQNPNISVKSLACPLFVPIVEEGCIDNEIAQLTAKMYLDEFVKNNVQAILMGCTHYPLLYNCIQKALPDVVVLNPAIETARTMKDYLFTNKMLNESQSRGNYKFFCSDNTDVFSKISKLVTSDEYSYEVVDIEK